jgi:hypothetical protein
MKERAGYGSAQIEFSFQTRDLPIAIEINGFHSCLSHQKEIRTPKFTLMSPAVHL